METAEEVNNVESELTPEQLAAEEARMNQPGMELNIELLKQLMKTNSKSWENGNTEILKFSDMYIEWTKLFKHLGSAISIAFQDISDKGLRIRNNPGFLIETAKVCQVNTPEALFMKDFIKLEAQLNIQNFNGENNKKTMATMKKDAQPWMKDYCSTSRHLWRGVWFFHFLSILFKDVNTNRKDSVSSLASNAYKKALAPYHPWILRKVASAAMIAVRGRENFINGLVDEQTKV